MELDGNEVQLKYMKRSGSCYQWPEKDEKSWQETKDIISVMPHPTYKGNSRNLLEFSNEALEKTTLDAHEKNFKTVNFL